MSVDKKIIITGFGPFGEIPSNPTEKLIRSLEKELQDELYQLYVLPVSYSYCADWSEDHISESTSLVIHFGVSAKSNIVQLERTGRNVIGQASDIDGSALGEKVIEGGPETLQSELKIDLVCSELNKQGFKCELSDNAGDYLCNFILYKSLRVAPGKALFVHVPPESELSIEDLKAFTLNLIRNLQDQVK